jgi:hypothetical protein
MPKKINLSAANKSTNSYENNKPTIMEGENHTDDSGVVQEIMDKKYPDKMLFDIQTVATELNRSYEFVRMRTNNGQIKIIRLGTTKMIPRNEFIKLLTAGVL